MNPVVGAWLAERPLFCLICGDRLKTRDGELFCEAGDAGYAPFAASCIAQGLSELVGLPAPIHRDVPTLEYSCPVCRGAFVERAPRMRCGHCGFCAGRGLWLQLVERTSHA